MDLKNERSMQFKRIQMLFGDIEPAYARLVSYSGYNTNEYGLWYSLYKSQNEISYDKDWSDCEKSYKRIVALSEEILGGEPENFNAKGCRVLARYSLGVLYTGRGNYDKGLRELELAIGELESSQRLSDELQCEHIDCYLKMGMCYIEKRYSIERVEACYKRIEECRQANLNADDYNQDNSNQDENYTHKCCLECCKDAVSESTKTDRLVYKTSALLDVELSMAQARLSIDAFDQWNRDRENTKIQKSPDQSLREAEQYLKEIWTFLELGSEIEYVAERTGGEASSLLSKIDEVIASMISQTTVEDEHKNSKKEINVDYNSHKVAAMYLTTRGLYHLKKYQFEKYTSEYSERKSASEITANEAELEAALDYFDRAHNYDPFNTIAMDNIAYIALMSLDRIEKEKSDENHLFNREIKPAQTNGKNKEGIYNHHKNKTEIRALKNAEDLEEERLLDEKTSYINNGTDYSKFYKNIYNSLEIVLKIEPCNMYALNLRNLLERKSPKKKLDDRVFEIYVSLRISTLKKRLKRLDSYMLRILEYRRDAREKSKKDAGTDGQRSLDQKEQQEEQRQQEWEAGCILSDLKQSLIELYSEVSKFYGATIIDLKQQKGRLRIGHYTQMKVLPMLVNAENSAKLHLSNIPYLNDPREGMIMLDMLKECENSETKIAEIKSAKTRGAEAKAAETKAAEAKAAETKAAGAGQKKDTLKNKVYKAYNSNELRRNYVYIGCFTSSLDTLAMWERYGDKGTGVCLEVDVDKSFDNTQAVDLNYVYEEDNVDDLKSMDGVYALHRVLYCPDSSQNGYKLKDIAEPLIEAKDAIEFERLLTIAEGEIKRISQLVSKDSYWQFEELRSEFFDAAKIKRKAYSIVNEQSDERNLAEKLNTCIEKLSIMDPLAQTVKNIDWILKLIETDLDFLRDRLGDCGESWDQFEDQVMSIIMLLLDQVRYLVKSSYFKDEEEYRVIKYSSSPQCDDTRQEIPMVYVEMRKPLHYKEICIGPKVLDPVSVGAYILNMGRDEGDGSISVDTTVRKSIIPYR